MDSFEKLKLEVLYERYKNQIYALCLHLTGSGDVADDLFGDTWVRVAEKYGQLEADRNPLNWIYTVCMNIYRKARVKNYFLTFFSDRSAFENIKSNDLHPESLFVERETNGRLHRALKKLPDKYRVPVILFYFKDCGYQDIADIMRLPMSTVKFRLNQAKKLLKQNMEV
jgi:RNA polymerase sigma-70 factor (ECF subfamily)